MRLTKEEAVNNMDEAYDKIDEVINSVESAME